MTRQWKIAITVGILVVAQVVAVAAYRAVTRARAPATAASFEVQRLSDPRPAPAIAGKRADGTEVALRWPAAHTRLVHFWATWCEPCRHELPGLLAFAHEARDHGIEVVAIAVDDDWKHISTFFGGTVPPEVLIENAGAAHKRFGVSTLPDSYLVSASGELLERYHGARDWRASAARDHLLARIK